MLDKTKALKENKQTKHKGNVEHTKTTLLPKPIPLLQCGFLLSKVFCLLLVSSISACVLVCFPCSVLRFAHLSSC